MISTVWYSSDWKYTIISKPKSLHRLPLFMKRSRKSQTSCKVPNNFILKTVSKLFLVYDFPHSKVYYAHVMMPICS